MKKLKTLYEKYKDFIMEVIHFGMVGVINTFMGWVIIFILYNIAHMNYWFSSAISYLIGSIFSYHANAKVTFKVEGKERDKMLPWRFAINIIVCYLVAFSVAKPLVTSLLSSRPKDIVEKIAVMLGMEFQDIVENIALILGMGFFIVMNFFGQKLFVFRKVHKKQQNTDGERSGG
ncbi:MAG: GtrA family protein [Clostridium sp.]|nr:GtrA family protein [Clostridium sp.]